MRLIHAIAFLLLSAPMTSLQAQVTQPADSTATVTEEKTTKAKGNEEEKRKLQYLLYTGLTVNNLNMDDDVFESNSELGYDLGFAVSRNKFFYWQAGVRYNSMAFEVRPVSVSDTGDYTFSVKSIDVPLTGGINFLSATDRIIGLRVFLSAMPSFNIGVNDNLAGITKDDINTFVFYGQGGVGVDVLFLVLDVGYNFGFNDLLSDEPSTPGQLFANLGFRF